MTRDPVCDKEVDELDAAAQGLMREYEGHVYRFCSGRCLREFDRSPESYMLHMVEVDRMADDGAAVNPNPS